MRTLDAALITKQQADDHIPYMRVHFSDRVSTTYTFTTKDSPNRCHYVEQWEEPYSGVAIIRLSNYDGYFTAKDLRGYSVTVGWGWELTGSPGATWYSNAADMRIRVQRDISFEGTLLTEFYCVSKWAEIEASYVLAAGKKLTGSIINGSDFVLGETITGSVSGATGILTIVGSNYIVVTRVSGTFQAAEDADGASASCDTLSAISVNYGPMVYKAADTATSSRIGALLSNMVTGVTVDEDDDDGNMAAAPLLAVSAGTSVRDVIRQMLLKSKCGMRYENDDYIHILYLDMTDTAQYEFDSNHAFFTNLRERTIIMPNTVIFVDQMPDADGNAATYKGTANDPTSVAAIGELSTIQSDNSITSDDDATKRAEAWIAQQVAEAYQGQVVTPMECGLEVYDMVQCVDSRLNVTAKGRIGRIERVFEPSTSTYETRINLGGLLSVPGAMDTGNTSIDDDLHGITNKVDPTKHKLPKQVITFQLPPALLPYTLDIAFAATDNDDITWGAGTITFADKSTQSIQAGSLNLANANPYYLYCTIGDDTLNNTQTFGDAVGGNNILVAFAIKGANTSTKALIVAGTQGPKLFVDTLSSITANFGLMSAGEVRIGSGDLNSYTFTGWRLWVDSNIGRMAGYQYTGPPADSAHEVVQWYTDTDGRFYSGGGGVVIDNTGLFIVGASSMAIQNATPTTVGQIGGVVSGDGIFRIECVAGTMNLKNGSAYIDIGPASIHAYPNSAGGFQIDDMKSSQADVTASRAIDGTVYQNNSSYPLLVTVFVTATANPNQALAYVEAGDDTPDVCVAFVTATSGAANVASMTFFVPVGSYYKVTNTSMTLSGWIEWSIGG